MEFTTLNKIVSLLSEVCEAHAQVSSFYFGEEVDIAASQQEQYPLVWANVLTSNISGKTLIVNIEVLVMDIQRASQENELHTLSDTLNIAQDIYAAMNNPAYQDYFLLSENLSLEPMREALPDLVNGWRMGLNFEIAQTLNRCQIPTGQITEEPVNTVLPLITGDNTFGSTLECSTGTWSGLPVITFTYQWKRNGNNITGANSSTYVIGNSDSLAVITCQVVATNDYGIADALSSNSINVENFNPVNTVAPTINPTLNQVVGTIFTSNVGTWTGASPLTYSYRWTRNGTPITGATNQTYTAVSADEGTTLRCEVRASNAFSVSAFVPSSNSANIGVAPANTVAPTVSPSGTQSTGAVITANVGTWAGTSPIIYAYRWTRNGTPITGATASTYTIQVADDGTTIRCEVKGTNAFGESNFIASSNSVSAVNAIAPVNTVAPVATGTGSVGSTLTTTNGTWTGIPSPTFTYQWQRNGSPITGATASTYVVQSADAGTNVRCVVTGTNSAGSASANSNAIAIAAPLILDTYPNARYAYSLRLLRSAYTGNAIRVRRSSDNSEQNIGFVNGVLDESTLTSFIGANDGFVVTWYDQSGNGSDATNANLAFQAKIVDAGTVNKVNSKAALQFYGLPFYPITAITPNSSNYTSYVARGGSPINAFIAGVGTTVNDAYIGGNFFGDYYVFSSGKTFIGNVSDNLQNDHVLLTVANNGSAASMYKNGSAIAGSAGANVNLGNNINAIGRYAGWYVNEDLQETIYWDNNQLTNRTGIETDMNNYYGVY